MRRVDGMRRLVGTAVEQEAQTYVPMSRISKSLVLIPRCGSDVIETETTAIREIAQGIVIERMTHIGRAEEIDQEIVEDREIVKP